MLITWIMAGLSNRTGVLKLPVHRRIPVILLVSALITFIPLKGISLAEYVLSTNPVFSIGSISLFFVITWKQFGGKPLLSELDLLLFATWNVAVSLYLYLSYLGFLDYDLYSLGYGLTPLFLITALLTILFHLFRSPVLWIFIAYILAYDLRLLHSDNFFDYITDGVLFIISLAILATYIVKSIVSRPRANIEGPGT